MRWSSALAALAVGIGTTRLIETVKESIPVVPPPHYKSLASTAVAATAGAGLSAGDWRERSLTGLAAAGTAMLVHEIRSLLAMAGDRHKVEVLKASTTLSIK